MGESEVPVGAVVTQVRAGRDVLNGELVLSSGLGMSLGAIIHVIRSEEECH